MKLNLYRNIGNLLSLEGVAKKKGRRVLEADLAPIKQAAVLVADGKIVWLGKEKSIPKKFFEKIRKEIDCGAGTILPAFVECHTHTIFAGSRANEFEMRMQGQSYQEIAAKGGGILSTVQAVEKASEAELITLAEERLREFRRQGVALVEIKSGYGLTADAELKMLKVADQLKTTTVVSTFLGAHAIPKKYLGRPKDYLDYLLRTTLPKVIKDTNCRRADIFIEKGFFEAKDSVGFLTKCQALGMKITVHADQLSRSGGTELAVSLNASSADHVIRVNAQDIRQLAKSDVTAVLLPAADLYMKCPYPPARKMIDAGVRVAVATDFNPGSSPTQEISLVGLLARTEMKMSLPEVIAAYTWNAAKALDYEDRLGSLELGKWAELACFDLDWDHLFYSVGKGSCKLYGTRGVRI